MALRDPLIASLKAGLPEGWTVWDDDLPERLNKRSVAVFTRRLQFLPEAPGACYSVEYIILVASPLENPAKAEDQRDDMLTEVLEVLWGDEATLVESAEVADYQPNADGGTVLVWQINATRIIQKEDD